MISCPFSRSSKHKQWPVRRVRYAREVLAVDMELQKICHAAESQRWALCQKRFDLSKQNFGRILHT